MEAKDSENIYYNVRITSETSGGLASFNETRSQPILDNPSNYEMAVERFYVPALNIPIMVFRDNYYFVGMKYGGNDYSTAIEFIPNSENPEPFGNVIFNYQEMLNAVNVKLVELFNDVKGDFPAAPPTEAPFITYEAESQLFTFHAERLYNETVAGMATIEIFFNTKLFRLFNSFQDFEQEEQEPFAHQILVKNNGNNETTLNSKPYYSTLGQWVTLYGWNDLQSIIFQTSSIPVVPEFNQSQTNETQQIITDFEPLPSVNNRSAFQFYPQGPLRWYSLKSNAPLYTLNLNVMWKSIDGTMRNIVIDDSEILTCKILFRRIR